MIYWNSPILLVQTEYPLSPCNHEKLDIRVMLHAANASSQGYKCILIVANDPGIIALGISFYAEIGTEKLYMGIILSKQKVKVHSYPSHLNTMSPAKACALPAFHALTGYV